MSRFRRLVDTAVVVAFASALLGACASRVGTVVLLPEKEGRETSVAVRGGDTSVVLAQPYAAADLTTAGAFGYQSSAEEVQALFGTALAAQPDRPIQFTLYFVEGSNELTDDSRRIFETALAQIAQRPVPDIVIVGHTDLRRHRCIQRRAGAQARRIRAYGADRSRARARNHRAVGRGKRQPAIPTPDGVAEPRNRRVEIIVR